jgi:hypothetical protein
MTRLFHSGAESQHYHAEGLSLVGTTLTADTGVKRTGTASFKFDASAANNVIYSFTGVAGRGYYLCAYIYIPTATGYPGSLASIMRLNPSSLYSVQLNTSGQLRLVAGATLVGSVSAALDVDTWYRVELFLNVGSGSGDDSAELRLNGDTVASESGATRGTAAPTGLAFGWMDDPGTSEVIYFDDVALNDDQGSVNNTWIGEHAVYCLLPASDNTDGNWTGGSGGASLFPAVNNTPPTGVATGASSNDDTQIENASGTVSSTAVVNMQTYTAAGIGSDRDITALYTVIEAGSSSTTGSDTITHELATNPTVAANGTNSVDIVAGTYPTNWNRGQGTITENPSVTLGDAPRMAVTKTVSTTRIHTVCFMGIMVDTVAAAAGRRHFSPIMVG